jgi:hypothetical protein
MVAALLSIVGAALATEFAVSNLPGQELWPAISHCRATWTLRTLPGQDRVFWEDLILNPNQPSRLPSNLPNGIPSISGDTIVWSNASGLNKFDAFTQTSSVIDYSPGIGWPYVDGNVVVWQQRNSSGNSDIWGRNLATTSSNFLIASNILPTGSAGPVVGGNVVAWLQKDLTGTYSLYSCPILPTGTPTCIGTLPKCATILGISSETVVLGQENPDPTNPHICTEDIYGYNISGTKKTAICAGPWFRYTGWHNGVSGNIVVWADWRDNANSLSPTFDMRAFPSVLFGYDLTTGQEFPITSNSTTTKCCPAVSGNTAVWLDRRNASLSPSDPNYSNTDVYGEDFTIPTHTIVVGKGRAKPGESGILPISLKGGADVFVFSFDLKYDATKNIYPTSIIPSSPDIHISYSPTDLTQANGTVHISGHATSGLFAPDGEVARVTFKVDPNVPLGTECCVWASGIKLIDQSRAEIHPVGDVIGKFSALPMVDHFAVQVIPGAPEPQGTCPLFLGQPHPIPLPFTLHVEARDEEDQLQTYYGGNATLTTSVGLCKPQNLNFPNGVWEGPLSIFYDKPASAALTASDVTLPASGASPSFDLRTKGDVNGDTLVDHKDYSSAAKLAIGKPVSAPPRLDFQQWAAEVNSDNVVNVLDVVSIVNMSLGHTPSPSPSQGAISLLLKKVGGVWEVTPLNPMGLAGVQLEITPTNATVSTGPLASGWDLDENIVNGKLRVIAYDPNATGISSNSNSDVLLHISGITGAPTITNKVFSDKNGNAILSFP